MAFHANHRTGWRCSWSSRFLPWAVTLVGHADSRRTGTVANITQFLRINKVLVTQSYQTLCDCMDCSPPGSSIHGDSPGKNTGVGFHALLQGIFATQGLNPGLLHCRLILYHLSHQGSPRILEWVAYTFSRGSS